MLFLCCEKNAITNNCHLVKNIDCKDLSKYDINIPVILKGQNGDMIHECRETGRDFYLIDTGYLGNNVGYLGNNVGYKYHRRIVKNGFHHLCPIKISKDRYIKMANFIYNTYGKLDHIHKQGIKYPFYNKQWNKNGKNILIIKPGISPNKFNKVNEDQWLDETISTLKQHTDRKIIIRHKFGPKTRIGDNNIYNQLANDDVFAVVVFDSIVAVESIMFGIPAFSTVQIAVSHLSLNDFSKIETPYYPPRTEVIKTLYWLTYCQYTKEEIRSGYAFELIQKYDLK